MGLKKAYRNSATFYKSVKIVSREVARDPEQPRV